MPSWVTAVNDAPASSAKNTRDAIARCPDDDTGRNSVSPCSIARTITCDPRHRRHVRHDDDRTVERRDRQRLGRGTGCAAATASRTAAARLRSSERSMSVSLRVAGRDDVLGLRHRPAQPRAVDLDDQRLAFDVEGEASTVADLAKPAGVHTSRNVLDGKLSVVQIPVCGEGHVNDHNSTHAARPRARRPACNSGRAVCLHWQFDRYPIRTSESYPLPLRRKHARSADSFVGLRAGNCSDCRAARRTRSTRRRPTIAPAQAAVSPPVPAVPGGIGAAAGRPCAGRGVRREHRVVGRAQSPARRAVGDHHPHRATGATPVGAVARARDAMTGDGEGRVYLSTRGGYFRVDLAGGHRDAGRRRRAEARPTSPRSRGAPTAGWCSAAPTAPCTP